MPTQSTRHLFNRTRFNRTLNLVSWSLEFIFALNKNTTNTNNKNIPNKNRFFNFNTKTYIFSGKHTLKKVLTQFYAKFKSELFDRSNYYSYANKQLNEKQLNEKEENVRLRRQLYEKFNESLGGGEERIGNELSLLYEVVDVEMRKRYFLRLDLEKSLEENLMNKTIIEYPSLYVVRNEDLGWFKVVDEAEKINEEEEEEEEEKEEEEEEDKMNGDKVTAVGEGEDENDEEYLEDESMTKTQS
jgi:hypothetical protein